jgi:flavin-dependent dehydrogenase
MILRKKFDYELVKLAINSGTSFMDGISAEDIKILDNKAKILLDDGTNIESEIVIGADGVWSTIAKKSKLRRNTKNICMCLFKEYPMSKKTLDRFLGEKRSCHIHINVNKTVGYGWVFPKKEHVNIGITEFKQALVPSRFRANLKDTFENYIKILKEDKIIPDNLKIGRIRGAALPTCPYEKTYSDRVILCGDAAGLANPISGEGIYYAMSSGKIAAEVITTALDKNNTSEKFLSRYQTIWNKDFGRELKFFYRTSMLWGKDNEKLFRIISKDKQLSELVLDLITGQTDLRKCKGKIIRRVFYLSFKDKLIKHY